MNFNRFEIPQSQFILSEQKGFSKGIDEIEPKPNISTFSRSLTRVISRPRKDPGAKAYNVALFSVLEYTGQTIPVVFNAKVSRLPLLLFHSTLH